MVAVVLSRDELVGSACVRELIDAGYEVADAATVDEVCSLVAAGVDPTAFVVVAPIVEALDDPPGFVAEVSELMAVVVAAMVDRGQGRIVFVVPSTGLGTTTWGDGTGTAAWGLVGLARGAARELAASGVTVNVVRAGVIEGVAGVPDGAPIADTPLRRAGSPDDLAAAVGYLVSDDAAYVTGIVLPVDGGLTMGQGA